MLIVRLLVVLQCIFMTLRVFGKHKVAVDWIVRNDGYAKYYKAALSDAIAMPKGYKFISPE